MRGVPADIAKKYSMLLRNKGIPPRNHYHFQKWLRYYADFCQKYHFILADKDSLPHFVRKLHEKSQSVYQRKQASHASSLYCELLTGTAPEARRSLARNISRSQQGSFEPQKTAASLEQLGRDSDIELLRNIEQDKKKN